MLTDYAVEHAMAARHPYQNKVSRTTVHRMLSEVQVKSHQVRDFLERRDTDFEAKMR